MALTLGLLLLVSSRPTSAVCLRPDGSRVAATSAVLGSSGELLLPLEITLPGMDHFRWTLAAAGGQTLAAGERVLYLQPFVNDRIVARTTMARLRQTAAEVALRLPLASAALEAEAGRLEQAAGELEARLAAAPPPPPTATPPASDLAAARVARAQRAGRIAAVAAFRAELLARVHAVVTEETPRPPASPRRP